jgi:hypothetical protein
MPWKQVSLTVAIGRCFSCLDGRVPAMFLLPCRRPTPSSLGLSTPTTRPTTIRRRSRT